MFAFQYLQSGQQRKQFFPLSNWLILIRFLARLIAWHYKMSLLYYCQDHFSDPLPNNHKYVKANSYFIHIVSSTIVVPDNTRRSPPQAKTQPAKKAAKGFCQSWLQEFKWLEFAEGQMRCKVCREAKKNSPMVSGCTNFRKSLLVTIWLVRVERGSIDYKVII